MRLLLVTRDFPLHASEVPGWPYELGRRFVSRCHDFALIAPRVAAGAELDRKLPFEVIRLPCKAGSLAGVLSLRLRALCRARPFDALLGAGWQSSTPGVLWRGRGGPGRVFAALPARDLDGSLRLADASEPHARVRRRVLEQLDGVFPLDGGCDTNRFTPGTSAQLARELGLSGRRVLLSRGPLTRASGIDTILYALSALTRRYPDLHYMVAGDGPARGELERLALRLHLSHKVQFLGPVAGDRLPHLVQLCEIFVHARRDIFVRARRDIFAHARRDPRTELNAMSAGQPLLPPGVLRHASEARAPAAPRSERPGRAAHRSNDAILN